MKFALGFVTAEALSFTLDDIKYLNLYKILKDANKLIINLEKSIDSFLSEFNSDNDIYVSATALLQQQIIKEQYGFKQLSSLDIDGMTYVIAEMYLKTRSFKKIEWIREDLTPVDFSVNGLYVRYGMVEIRLLDSLLRNPEKVNGSLHVIHNQLNDSDFMYQPMKQDASKWLSSGDLDFNLKALMTNAGFYLSERFGNALSDLEHWKTAYISGILKGRLLSVPPAYPWFFGFSRRIQESLLSSYIPEYLHFPSSERFFEMLKGKNVLILSPFKNQIDRMIKEGRLEKLYKNFKIFDINFISIEAPISTYPNRPGAGWMDSFSKLKSDVDNQFNNVKFDFFTASCGCYGIPICEYVYSQYSCTSLYYGNWLNTMMGIRQKCSLDFVSEINEELRIDGDLARFKNIEKIDDGRYL
jgi:hypothetical protein